MIHVNIDEMVQAISFVNRDELATIKAAVPGSSCAILFVLFQTSTNHQSFTITALLSQVVHEARSEEVLSRFEWLLTTKGTGHEMRYARRTEETAAGEALSRTCAELCAHGAPEFVTHVYILQVIVGLYK